MTSPVRYMSVSAATRNGGHPRTATDSVRTTNLTCSLTATASPDHTQTGQRPANPRSRPTSPQTRHTAPPRHVADESPNDHQPSTAMRSPAPTTASADERAPSPRPAWLSLHWSTSGCRSGRVLGPGFTPGPRVTAARPQFRSMPRPVSSDRGPGKSCSSAAGRLRSDAVRTSPSAICLAEHRVEFRVEPELPDLLRTAAGDGDLGSPLHRLLA